MTPSPLTDARRLVISSVMPSAKYASSAEPRFTNGRTTIRCRPPTGRPPASPAAPPAETGATEACEPGLAASPAARPRHHRIVPNPAVARTTTVAAATTYLAGPPRAGSAPTGAAVVAGAEIDGAETVPERHVPGPGAASSPESSCCFTSASSVERP